MGYHRAGFDVVGVDIHRQPRYPFAFIQADALIFAQQTAGYDAIHASPPCKAHSRISSIHGVKAKHPDLVPATRALLIASGLPYVIENVPGAPLKNAVCLCGSSFGLDVRRHRLFESSALIFGPQCEHDRQTPRFRSLNRLNQNQLASVVGVHGHLNYPGERQLRERAMGIDWMTPAELSQAIPPAYTEYIGRQLLPLVSSRRVA